jgi:hypothetical protein
MYTTKRLSLFKSHPEAASWPPPEGRDAGHLVVKGAADEDNDHTCCWGTCCSTMRVWELPFPQNHVLTVKYQDGGKEGSSHQESVVFVPVPGQPLASNRYYAVIAKGKRKGLVRACSREEDMATRCFCRCVKDVEPRPFDPADVYQQIEVVRRARKPGWFTARAVAADGVPSSLYRSKYWEVYDFKQRPKKNFDLGEALGLDATLRSRQLAGAFPVPGMAVVVGKWYCPFFLVKEHGVAPRQQMERSAFYEVVLEQRWEPVRGDAIRCAHDRSKLASKKALIGGVVEAKLEGRSSRDAHAYLWFVAATGERVGVCRTVCERMLWEQNRGGWVDEKVAAGNVAGGELVLVERFAVKRMDRSVAVAFDFVHHNSQRAENRAGLVL